MSSSKFVSFISSSDFSDAVQFVLDAIRKAEEESEEKIYSNVLDPFSAVFESVYSNLSLTEWLKKEQARQIQKTMQNSIGEFHQKLLGHISGWEDLGRGDVVDIRNKARKIVAEVKNKYNTTKGNHKTSIYDDLEKIINEEKGYVGYYVEIIPKKANRYDKPFVPSDNRTGTRRPVNERIRVIDGYSFYELASKKKDALRDVYRALPEVVAELVEGVEQNATHDTEFKKLFSRAFGVDM